MPGSPSCARHAAGLSAGKRNLTAAAAIARRLSGLIPIAAGLSAPVRAQDGFADPAGSGPIVHAMGWLQGTLLGTVATAAAVIAVATVGFLMLTGRMNWRYGATVILGCFILFGAAAIVGGIQATASQGY